MAEYVLQCKECNEVHELDTEEDAAIAMTVGCARCCGGTLEQVKCDCGYTGIIVEEQTLECESCGKIWDRPPHKREA